MNEQQKKTKASLPRKTDTDSNDPLDYKKGYYILFVGILDIIDKLMETISTKQNSEATHILSEVYKKLIQLNRDAEYACTEPPNE